MMVLLLLAATSGAAVTTIAATVAGIFATVAAAIAGVMAVRVNRRTAMAADKTAEGAAIKAIAEANRLTLESLQAANVRQSDVIARLESTVERLNTVVDRQGNRLNQERQWTVRLIRALNAANVAIPIRPATGDTDENAIVTSD